MWVEGFEFCKDRRNCEIDWRCRRERHADANGRRTLELIALRVHDRNEMMGCEGRNNLVRERRFWLFFSFQWSEIVHDTAITVPVMLVVDPLAT